MFWQIACVLACPSILRWPAWSRFSPPRRNTIFFGTTERQQCGYRCFSIYDGNCYLGIDAGSTTTKAAVVGEDGSLLYSFYSNNQGNPLATSIRAIQEIYEQMPDSAHIAYACSTGYGEALIKAALLLDEGEVETIAHYTAALL